jgi:HD-like signal output (HDOD) protein
MGAPQTIAQWVDMLGAEDLPVLARSVAELERLRARGDNIALQRVTDAVLHDPFMTAKVLRYLQQHRGGRRTTDITTIAHGLMMLGLSPFYAHFGMQSAIEDRLAGSDAALRGLLKVMNRARHAALYAQDWARLRKDIDPEEIMVAALLHDLAEMLLWCFAPSRAMAIAELQSYDRTMRSEIAQKQVLGCRLIDLQLAMVKAWHLPDLLHVLMDAQQGRNPRALNVEYAVALARHASHGWDDAALPHDFAAIGAWLGLTPEEVSQRVAEVCAHVSDASSWYGANAMMPPIMPPQRRQPEAAHRRLQHE